MKVKENQNTQEYFFEEGCYITELWNENHDSDLSVARARVRPGETTQKHALTATTERYLVVEGEGKLFLGSQAAQKLKKDDVILIPPDMPQCIQNTGQKDLVFLAICTPRFSRDNYRELE